jgi:glycosyltransferase involved in cell wall biosynthesis
MRRHVIAPATDPDVFSPPPRGEAHTGPLRLLCVGPLRWSQGYEHALHALRLLLDRGTECELRIAGSGEFAPAVAFARYQLGLEDRVTLIEPTGAAELRDEYARADVFVSAAVVEGTPRALLDSQAMALPAVVSDAGRAPDSMDGTGLVAARRDPEALADSLARLAADAAMRRRMGERARKRAEAIAADEHLDAFGALYSSLASRAQTS